MSEEAKKSVINRGKRTFTLKPHADGRARVLHPGKSIECLDAQEFKHLAGYNDIADVDAIAPQLAHRETQLRKQLAEAEAENKKLKAQREAAPAPEPVVAKPQPEPEPVKVQVQPKAPLAPKAKPNAKGKK